MSTPTTTDRRRPAPLPPRWVIRAAWTIHRAIYALTVGRRSGSERQAILGYFEDGPNLVTMAMNGWGDAEPAWWLNLQANPDTTVELPDGPRAVRGRAATPEERPRLWARWAEYDGEEALASWAARRSRETAVVILEPRPSA